MRQGRISSLSAYKTWVIKDRSKQSGLARSRSSTSPLAAESPSYSTDTSLLLLRALLLRTSQRNNLRHHPKETAKLLDFSPATREHRNPDRGRKPDYFVASGIRTCLQPVSKESCSDESSCLVQFVI